MGIYNIYVLYLCPEFCCLSCIVSFTVSSVLCTVCSLFVSYTVCILCILCILCIMCILCILCILCPDLLKYCGGSGEVASTYHLPQKQIDLSQVGATIENISKTRVEKERSREKIGNSGKKRYILCSLSRRPMQPLAVHNS